MSGTYPLVQQGCVWVGKTEEGVSPVVGVMLMLAVTIIIAAIVSAAAGQLFRHQGKSPLRNP